MAKSKHRFTVARKPKAEKPAKPAKAAKAEKPKKTKAVKPRQQTLGGMQSGEIAELEQLAAAYARIRDERAELTREESGLKQQTLRAMHKYGKTVYQRGGVMIVVAPGEEQIKVKIAKRDDDEDDQPDLSVIDAPVPDAAAGDVLEANG